MFVDDVFIFFNGYFEDEENLEEILIIFGNASGMLINHQKFVDDF
jgi:hypothetical protein